MNFEISQREFFSFLLIYCIINSCEELQRHLFLTIRYKIFVLGIMGMFNLRSKMINVFKL